MTDNENNPLTSNPEPDAAPNPDMADHLAEASQPDQTGARVTSSSERVTHGQARARHEQRKRTQQTGRMSSRSSTPRQIQPIGQFKLPQIHIPINRGLFGVVGAVLFIIVIVFALGRLRNNPIDSAPNAIWIGTEWTYDERTSDEIITFANGLRDDKIGTIYAWVSWLQPDKKWRGEDKFENVKTFVKAFRAAYPDAKLYGWVSVPTESDPGVTRINDADLQQEVATFSQRVISEFGFDGIFLNAEPVWDGDEGFLGLLRAVRAAVGLDVPIAAALPPDWSPANATIPVPPLILPGTEWEKTYKQSVALLIDQLVVMAYQSGLSSPEDYSQWVAYQVKTYADAIAELDTNLEILIGVPTYPDELPGHVAAVENVESAVAGVRDGLKQAGDAASYVIGIAIYAEWTTDSDQWAVYKRAWLGQ